MVPRGGGAQRRGFPALDIVDESLDIRLVGDLQRRGDATVGAMADGHVVHATAERDDGLQARPWFARPRGAA